ncbi:MAG TPA: hypothetical protein VNP04_08325 [Alphaproteobacteria bacterium]|nr:hypothetical protein [Alphaproteobacteria bacterium]
MTLQISPKRLAYVLAFVASWLGFVNIAIHFAVYILGYDHLLRFAGPFTFRGNTTLAKWFASSNLLFCAALLAVIAWGKIRERDAYRSHWAALALIFCAVSVVETTGLHEMTTAPLKAVVPATGFLFHTWVVLGMLFTLVVALFYVRFLLHLPPETRRLFTLAATLYVGGALGIEILRGPYNEIYGAKHMTAEFMKTFEEFCQMSGIVVLIYALLLYIRMYIKELNLTFDDTSLSTLASVRARTRHSSNLDASPNI